MLFSKVIKLVGLFMREPADLIFLPVSIIFGYFHGFIKLYAGLTLRMTSWGSRADGDANDSHRMSPRARRSESITLPPGNQPGLIRYNDDVVLATEKLINTESSEDTESDSGSISDDHYDTHDTNDTSADSDSDSSSAAAEKGKDRGR